MAMARPKKKTFSLKEKLERIRQAGISEPATPLSETDRVRPLGERVQLMLKIVKDKPIKATEMTYLIMYDISNDKVRTQIAKYLEKQGCVRIQKSVFMARTENPHFQEIYDTLKEVNSYYRNEDSIILVPVNASDVRSMKLIGKNVQIETVVDKPNTLFF
jgi:CRISPR-associated endonuclease Cas2